MCESIERPCLPPVVEAKLSVEWTRALEVDVPGEIRAVAPYVSVSVVGVEVSVLPGICRVSLVVEGHKPFWLIDVLGRMVWSPITGRVMIADSWPIDSESTLTPLGNAVVDHVVGDVVTALCPVMSSSPSDEFFAGLDVSTFGQVVIRRG